MTNAHVTVTNFESSVLLDVKLNIEQNGKFLRKYYIYIYICVCVSTRHMINNYLFLYNTKYLLNASISIFAYPKYPALNIGNKLYLINSFLFKYKNYHY